LTDARLKKYNDVVLWIGKPLGANPRGFSKENAVRRVAALSYLACRAEGVKKEGQHLETVSAV
jgi:hypothetical protein